MRMKMRAWIERGPRVAGVVLSLLAVTIWAPSAFAADAQDLERLKETGSCPGCDLSDAELAGAQIPGSDLSAADLKGAVLYKAGLGGADLSSADLTAADLRGADLTGASLDGALLYLADLSGARLGLASLAGAESDASTTCPDGGSGPCDD